SLVEDKEPQNHALLTLGKCNRETPLAYDENISEKRMRTAGAHMTQPGYLALVQGVPNLE
ncbi:hypothetical protein KI387_035135, partial [Taxus chinensis]